MTDAKVSVNWHRKAKIVGRDYEMQEAGMTIEFTIPMDDPSALAREAVEAWQTAKAMVLTQLELGFNQDPETGRIIETFPGAEPVASRGTMPAAPAPEPQPAPAPAPGQFTQSYEEFAGGPPKTAEFVPPQAPQQFQGEPNDPFDPFNTVGTAQHNAQQQAAAAGVPPAEQPAQGAPIPDVEQLESWTDKCWRELLVNRNNWYDMRASKKSPDGPDFQAIDKEAFPQKGEVGAQYAQGLWLQSKYGPAPAWVTANLHLLG